MRKRKKRKKRKKKQDVDVLEILKKAGVDSHEFVELLLSELSPLEEKVLRLRYGISKDPCDPIPKKPANIPEELKHLEERLRFLTKSWLRRRRK